MLRVVFFLILPILAFSQAENDYQQIVSLLRVHRYAEAEPLLKNHLKTTPKPHTTAYQALGDIYYQKAVDNFISDDERTIVVMLDSSVYAYQRALALLTEDSFKANQHFYKDAVSDKQREVRFSDVQKELQEKIRKINKKLNRLHRKNDSLATLNIRKEGKYHALIIGASIYQNTNLTLDRPVLDAEQLKLLLTNRYTFDKRDVDVLLNPTRQDILKQMVHLRKKLSKRDNLLVFYAGHGFWDEEAQQGYWWPVDAEVDDPTFWLSNSDLRDQVRSIKTAHTLLISDACFSGGILKSRDVSDIRNAPADVILLYKHPSRRAMTSGSMSTVPDQSVFFRFLMATLESNTEKFLSSQALFDHIRKAVINNSLTVPQDGVILDTGDEGGDFIFIRKD